MIQVEAPLRESSTAQMTERFGMTEKMPGPVEECPCKVSAAYRRETPRQ